MLPYKSSNMFTIVVLAWRPFKNWFGEIFRFVEVIFKQFCNHFCFWCVSSLPSWTSQCYRFKMAIHILFPKVHNWLKLSLIKRSLRNDWFSEMLCFVKAIFNNSAQSWRKGFSVIQNGGPNSKWRLKLSKTLIISSKHILFGFFAIFIYFLQQLSF